MNFFTLDSYMLHGLTSRVNLAVNTMLALLEFKEIYNREWIVGRHGDFTLRVNTMLA